MAKNANFVSHKKSKQIVNGKPKLPLATDLVEGEIAINFGKDVETLSIKNESGDVVTFSSDNYYTEQKLGSGFTGENSGVTVTEALENFEITVDQDFSNTASTNPISTKAVYSAVTDNELVWTNAFVALSGTVSAHTENTEIHVTAADKAKLHTHTNKTALDSITGNVGTMAYQNANNYSSATEVQTALSGKANTASTLSGYGITNAYTKSETSGATELETAFAAKANTTDLANFFDDAKYEDSGNTKVINFYHGNNIKATIDASDFIVDGMVEDVRIENGYLIIDFNTASGKQDISIPLTDIFDPSNYYNKTAIDNLVGSGFTSSSITEVIIENEEIVSNALTDLDERKLDATAYTPTDLSNYYTKSETSGKTEIQNALNAKTDTGTTTALNNVVTAHTSNADIHVTTSDKTTWNAVTAKTDNSAFTAHTASTSHMTSTEKDNLDSLASNISIISGITSEKVGNWDDASNNAHNHSNKTILDNITAAYTITEQTKLSGIADGAQVNVIETVNVNGTALTPSSKSVNVTVPTKTSDLENDSNFVSDVSYVHTDNNYTATEKNKLSGIAEGAEVNVQSDWNATSGDAMILNKPTIPAAVAVKGNAETSYRTGNVNITPENIGLDNVGNFKAVSTVASQGLTDTEKANARANIGAGTSSFSGSYNDLSNKPTIATTAATGLMSADDKTKLNGIASGAEVNQNAFSNINVGSTTIAADGKTDTLEIAGSGIITVSADATNDKITISASNAVTSVAGKTGAVTLAKGDVGLGNVTNDTQVKRVEMGTANGVATLGSDGKVPSSQLPSYVDDVLEYVSISQFPSTGESGKIYVDTSTNKTYRWGGTSYVEISASLALGETSSTAYYGDKGKIAYDHSQSTHARTDATAVSFTRNLTSGTKIGTITINGNDTDLYCDTNTWRPITNTYTGSDTSTSVSQYGTNALYNALVNGYASSAGNADTVDGYHADNLFKWSNGTADTGSMSWGTLTSANGYSVCAHGASSDGGDMGFCYKDGQISMQLDGWFYQNEGQYRVLDTSDASSLSVNYANSAGSAPASDVYAWAKAESKPSYNYSEVGAAASNHNHDGVYQPVGNYLTSHQTVTLASGTNNGTLKITTAAGTTDNVAVKGINSMAYQATSSYSSATQVNTALANKLDKTEYATFSAATNTSIEDLSGQSETIAAALNDLNERKLDIDTINISSLVISSNTSSVCSITGSSNTGKIQTIIYKNSSTSTDRTVTVPTTYQTPDGAAIELTCPKNGYCEVSYLNIGGTIYARGL